MPKFCKRCGAFFDDDIEYCPEDGAHLSAVTHEQKDEADPLVGTVLDNRFHVQAKLGAGGMGSVYRALQASTRREVALKVILGDITDDGARRFMREAHTTSALRNVHTVTIFDFGRAPEGTLYLAMELLDGDPLDAVLKTESALPWQRALYITAQVAESLAEAHYKGIVHRDLKPANIFLTRMGADPDFVKVLDFGIAKLYGGGVTTELTGAGMVLGTPQYMSPEQARGQELDHRSDIYSLGVMLYHMLAGRPPFLSETPVGLLMQHCQDAPPPLEELRPDLGLPVGLLSLLDRMLVKKPELRIETALAVQQEALSLLQGVGSLASPLPLSASRPGRQAGDFDTGSTLAVKARETGEDGLVVEGATTTVDPTPPQFDPTVPPTGRALARWRGSPGVAALAAALLLGGGVAVWQLGAEPPPAGESLAEQPPTAVSGAEPGHSEVQERTTRPAATEGVSVGGGPVAVVEADAGRPASSPAAASEAASRQAATGEDVGALERQTRKLVLTSTPSGAEVFDRHGQRQGRTPLELDVSGKARILLLKKRGYVPKRVELPGGSAAAVAARLRRKAPRAAAGGTPRRMDMVGEP